MILMVASLIGRTQSVLYPSPREQRPSRVIYFVDSIKMDSNINMSYLSYLNPNDILNISIGKNPPYINGAVYITLKNHQSLIDFLRDKPISLSEISKSNLSEAKRMQPIIYFLDDKLITDTTNIRLPSKRVTGVILIDANEMPYFKTTFPNALVLLISTKPREIYIR
jgi:hypothetical protein